jgi:hypothetical protein
LTPEHAIVPVSLKHGGTCVLVLGGAHDLSDNIKRLSKACGYIVVTPKGGLREANDVGASTLRRVAAVLD